jgi:hypothetical protein
MIGVKQPISGSFAPELTRISYFQILIEYGSILIIHKVSTQVPAPSPLREKPALSSAKGLG